MEEDFISHFEIEKETITDIDGNVYTSLLIDEKWVMVDFLKVTHFNNGDPIPTRSQYQELDYAGEEVMQWPLFYNENDSVNGKLYTWYTTSDVRGICPEGYHVLSKSEYYYIKGFCEKWKIYRVIRWKLNLDDYDYDGYGIWYSDQPVDNFFGKFGAGIKCVKDAKAYSDL